MTKVFSSQIKKNSIDLFAIDLNREKNIDLG